MLNINHMFHEKSILMLKNMSTSKYYTYICICDNCLESYKFDGFSRYYTYLSIDDDLTTYISDPKIFINELIDFLNNNKLDDCVVFDHVIENHKQHNYEEYYHINPKYLNEIKIQFNSIQFTI